jgi:alpha-galactosidase
MEANEQPAAGGIDTAFARDAERVWLKRLQGLACGLKGEDGGLPRVRGLFSLATSLGEIEPDDLKLVHSRFGEAGAELSFEVPGILRLTSVWEFDQASGISARRDCLTNTGREPLAVYRCLSRFVLAPGVYDLYAQRAAWGNESQGYWTPLNPGRTVLKCEGGRTVLGSTPYLFVRDRASNRALAFHVLPEGNWTIRVNGETHDISEQLYAVVEAGPLDERFRLVLAPGESFALPEVLVQAVPEGEPHFGAPRLHRHALGRYFRGAKPSAPVIYNTWFGCYDHVHLPWLRDQLATAKDLGCEVFVMDAGWFGAGTGDWSSQVGDWRERQDAAYQGKMREFADEVRATGLKFGLWMEPERAAPAAPIVKEHPEWLVPSQWGNYRLNLEIPAARDHVFGEICRLTETYGLAWMKIDFNSELGLDAGGSELYRHFSAWYAMLEEVRRKYPGTFYEGCASGGLRYDLNTLRHFDAHFPSDNVTPVDMLRIYQGNLLRLPPGRTGLWMVVKGDGKGGVIAARVHGWDSPVPVDTDFLARICLMSMLGLSGEISGLPPEAKDKLKGHFAFYKKWRETTAGCEAHLLTPPALRDDWTGWANIQLSHPGKDAHFLFAFRLDRAEETTMVKPRGLDPSRRYRVALEDGKVLGENTGEKLMAEGLKVSLDQAFMAELVVLERA